MLDSEFDSKEYSYEDYLENPENYISVLIYKAPEED